MTINQSFRLGGNGSEGMCDIWGLSLEMNYLLVDIWTKARVRKAFCMAGGKAWHAGFSDGGDFAELSDSSTG